MAFIAPLLPTRPIRSSPRNITRTTPIAADATRPARVIPSPLPNLYVYSHCPFCVRVRHALGLKNVKHNLIWLLNDDVATPTSLVGKKIVPIFQPDGSGGPAKMESLDIIKDIDSNPRYGPPGMLQPPSGRHDITDWFSEVAMPLRRLTRIRFARAPLPEFAFQDGRDAYIRNHPLKEAPFSYEENFERSDEYIGEIQGRLDELERMIWGRECCTEGGVGFDDVDLFPRLRSMTIVSGLNLPPKIREYVEFQSETSEVPLYDYCAM